MASFVDMRLGGLAGPRTKERPEDGSRFGGRASSTKDASMGQKKYEVGPRKVIAIRSGTQLPGGRDGERQLRSEYCEEESDSPSVSGKTAGRACRSDFLFESWGAKAPAGEISSVVSLISPWICLEGGHPCMGE